MREAEGRLIPLLWHVGLDEWQQSGLDEAYHRFFADTPVPDDIQTHPEHESLFLTWLALRFAPEPHRGRSQDSAAVRLLTSDVGLSEFERRFLMAAETASPSFHVVKSAVAGESIELEDILTGDPWRVLEQSASRAVRPGAVLYARVVTLDGTSIMVGSGSLQLPPGRRADVADLREDLRTRGRTLTSDDVRAFEDMLRRWYLLAAEHERHPPPPRFTNTDGDPVAPTTLTFALRCTPAQAFEALRTLNATDPHAEPLPGDAERDDQGGLLTFSLDWTKRGNRMHQSWDNTILGHLEVRADTLTATVNSNRRASRLRKQIEKRLGHQVSFQRAVIESVDALMAAARAEPRQPGPELVPEVVAEFQQRHWQEWIDQPVPALKGQTPRQAARTAPGRERLEALLAEFEWRGGAPVQQLRAALKL